MSDYKLSRDGLYAIKSDTGAWHLIDASPDYLEWLADGNTPDPADPLPTQTVDIAQARLDLLQALANKTGMTDAELDDFLTKLVQQ